MKKESKFKVGDKVKIIHYGSLIWEHKDSEHKLSFPLISEDKNFRYLDMNPEEVGKKGKVTDVNLVQGKYSYALEGQMNKVAWYNEQQLELANK